MFVVLIRSCATILLLSVLGPAQSLPPGEGQDIVQHQCSGCHALKVVTSKRASRQQWSTLVDQMVSRGADVADDDIETVVQYLAKNFAPTPDASSTKSSEQTTINVNKATSKELETALQLSPKEAEAIAHYRVQNGEFKSLPDLNRVPGVDPKKIESHKDRIIF
jgi:competence protein ComEA